MNFFSFDPFRVSAVAVAVSGCLVYGAVFPGVALAEDVESEDEHIDVIRISASRASADDLSVADADPVESDVAQWLKTVPGANVNKNGPVTGIAQYRGMFASGLSLGFKIRKRRAKEQIPNPVWAGNSPGVATAFPTSLWVRWHSLRVMLSVGQRTFLGGVGTTHELSVRSVGPCPYVIFVIPGLIRNLGRPQVAPTSCCYFEKIRRQRL